MLSKKNEVRLLFEETLISRHFHEYECISKYLNKKDDALNLFLDYHKNKPQLTQMAVRYTWNNLIEKELWDICAQYTEYSDTIYEHSLYIFDSRTRMSNENTRFQDECFTEDTVINFIKEVTDLLLVYRHTNQIDKIKQIKEQVTADMSSRKYPEIIEQIKHNI